MRYLMLLYALVIFLNTSAQVHNLKEVKYIDYYSVIKDLDVNGDKSVYYPDLDYEVMLYLDKSSIGTLKKVNPNFLNEYDIDTIILFRRSVDQFMPLLDIRSTDIRDLFENKKLLNKALKQVIEDKNRKLDNCIYVKDNNTAIFTIETQSWNSTCKSTHKARLVDNKVSIELLYMKIESIAL